MLLYLYGTVSDLLSRGARRWSADSHGAAEEGKLGQIKSASVTGPAQSRLSSPGFNNEANGWPMRARPGFTQVLRGRDGHGTFTDLRQLQE